MDPNSGIYEIEFLVTDIHALDGFCRADIGVVIDAGNCNRAGSGVRWEAGDGDVFIADDACVDGRSGWLGDPNAVAEGVLPRWDEDGSRPGLFVDTYRHCLGFTMNGEVLPFELPLPPSERIHFVVSWSSGTGGMYSIKSCTRRVHDTLAISRNLANAKNCQVLDSTANSGLPIALSNPQLLEDPRLQTSNQGILNPRQCTDALRKRAALLLGSLVACSAAILVHRAARVNT
jgi:hypothetical protein